jgi:DNA-binding transcriptional LysR family regulator
LIDINYHIYGSTKYLEQYGHPKTIMDLNKHRFISFGKGTPSPVFNPDWALKLGSKNNKKRKPIMKVNSIYGLLLAVQSGVGLAALPDYITVSASNIVKVLPHIEGPKTESYFVYPQSLKNVARIIAFRNFLYSKISKWEF